MADFRMLVNGDQGNSVQPTSQACASDEYPQFVVPNPVTANPARTNADEPTEERPQIQPQAPTSTVPIPTASTGAHATHLGSPAPHIPGSADERPATSNLWYANVKFEEKPQIQPQAPTSAVPPPAAFTGPHSQQPGSTVPVLASNASSQPRVPAVAPAGNHAHFAYQQPFGAATGMPQSMWGHGFVQTSPHGFVQAAPAPSRHPTSTEDAMQQLQTMQAELARTRQFAEDSERKRMELEQRYAVTAQALYTEMAKVNALQARLGSGASGAEQTKAAMMEENEKWRRQVEEYYRSSGANLELKARHAQEEVERVRRQAAEQAERMRRYTTEEVIKVRRQADTELARVRREGAVEVARSKRRAEAEVAMTWKGKIQRTGDAVLLELCSLRALARACHEAGKRVGRVLEEVWRAGKAMAALSAAHAQQLGALRNFLGRYLLLLAHPPLPMLATIAQLASQEPPASPLALSAESALREAQSGGGERKGWEEVRPEWMVRRVGGGRAGSDACTRVLGLHAGGVSAVAVSEDGATVASGGKDKAVRVWDVATGQARGAPRKGHVGEVTCVAVSEDGGVVVSGGRDKMVRVWAGAGADGGREKELRGHMGEVTAVVLLRGRGVLKAVSGSTDETLRVWQLQEGEEQRGTPVPRRHPEGVTCLAVGRQEGVFVSGGRDGMVRLWTAWGSYTKWKQPQLLHGKPVVSVAFCEQSRQEGGDQIASVDEDGRVLVWSLPLETLLVDIAPTRHHPTVAAALPAFPGLVATGGLDTSLRVWEVSSWQEETQAAWGHAEEVTAVACAPAMVVTGSADNCVRVWDTSLLQRRPRVQVQAEWGAPPTDSAELDAHTFSSEPPSAQAVVASVHRDRQPDVVSVRGWLWPMVRGKLADTSAANAGGEDKQEREGHREAVTCVTVSGNGQVAASGSRDASVRLWDTTSGRAVGARLEGHKKRVTAVALSWDGKRVVSGGADKTVRVWGWGGEECCFSGHKMQVQSVAISPCGGKVLSGSKEAKESVRVWDVQAREKAPGPTVNSAGGVSLVWFTPDGRAYGSKSLSGHVTHWLCESGVPAPESDPQHKAPQTEKQSKAPPEPQLESVWGRHRVAAEEDLVLVFELAGSRDGAASSPRPLPSTSSPKGGGKSEEAAGKSAGAGKGKEGTKERCCGLYRARGPVKAVRAGRGATGTLLICAGCESGEVLILKTATLASEECAGAGANSGEGGMAKALSMAAEIVSRAQTASTS